jgi:hypothetical protein
MTEIWRGVGLVFDAPRSNFDDPQGAAPSGLGSGFYEGHHRLQRFAESGYIAASRKTAAPRFTGLVPGALRSQQVRDHARLKTKWRTLEERPRPSSRRAGAVKIVGGHGTDWLSDAEARCEGVRRRLPWTGTGLGKPDVHPHNTARDPYRSPGRKIPGSLVGLTAVGSRYADFGFSGSWPANFHS